MIITPIILNLLNIFHLVDLSFAFGFLKNTISLFDGIGIGVLIAFLYYYHEDFFTRHKKIMLFTGLILFVVALIGFFTINGSTHIIQIFELINGLVLSFSILFMIPFLSQMNPPKNKLIFASITYTSLISYSLYLTHTTIIEIFYKMTDFYPITNVFALYVKSFISLILVFLIAAFLYKVWEKPMTSIRERFKSKSKSKETFK
jgi:peptidoglycan/LPS O-acetylase OafA/YrhL